GLIATARSQEQIARAQSGADIGSAQEPVDAVAPQIIIARRNVDRIKHLLRSEAPGGKAVIRERAADQFHLDISRMKQVEMLGDAPQLDLPQAEIPEGLRDLLERKMLEAEVRPDQLTGRKARH